MNVPYEWYALLLMVLGDWHEVKRFENVLKQAYRYFKTGEKMKTPIILWGPAGSGKSTILNILELGFFTVNNINEMKNTIFVHDFDAAKAPPFYENKMWNYNSCMECTLNNHKNIDASWNTKERDKECPLIYVQPHGDLIDKDYLKQTHCAECTLYPDNCLEKSGKECDWGSIVHLNMCPVIIPAEEGT